MSTRTERRKQERRRAPRVDLSAEVAYNELAELAELECAAAALHGLRLTWSDALTHVVARDHRPTHELFDILLTRPMEIAQAVSQLYRAERPSQEIRDAVEIQHGTPFCKVAAELVKRGWSAEHVVRVFGR